MTISLLDEFLREECTPADERVLLDALADPSKPSLFNYNRFELKIDRAARAVVLIDILVASSDGVQRIGFDDFAVALRERRTK